MHDVCKQCLPSATGHAASLDDLERRIRAIDAKLPVPGPVAADAQKTTADVGQRAPPDYATAATELDKALSSSSERPSGTDGPELMCVYQLLLGRLEAWTAYIRFAGSDESQKVDICLSAGPAVLSYMKLRAKSLPSAEDAKPPSNFWLDSSPELPSQAMLDAKLWALAYEAVSIGRFDEAIKRYETETQDVDLEALRGCLYELVKRRKAHNGAILDFLEAEGRPTGPDPAAEKNEHEYAKINRRLTMAHLGAIALLAPMLIMTLHPGLLTALATTSVFVLFVAVTLALCMTEAEPKDVMASVAAYAAVLVVFVGTTVPTESSTSSPSSNSSAEVTSVDKTRIGWIVLVCIVGTEAFLLVVSLLYALVVIMFPTKSLPVPGDSVVRNVLVTRALSAMGRMEDGSQTSPRGSNASRA